jgi:hypothetical protein
MLTRKPWVHGESVQMTNVALPTSLIITAFRSGGIRITRKQIQIVVAIIRCWTDLLIR